VIWYSHQELKNITGSQNGISVSIIKFSLVTLPAHPLTSYLVGGYALLPGSFTVNTIRDLGVLGLLVSEENMKKTRFNVLDGVIFAFFLVAVTHSTVGKEQFILSDGVTTTDQDPILDPLETDQLRADTG